VAAGVERRDHASPRCSELAPQLVGALDERNVQWMLEVLLADDPAIAVR
jgi:hypothetical protein